MRPVREAGCYLHGPRRKHLRVRFEGRAVLPLAEGPHPSGRCPEDPGARRPGRLVSELKGRVPKGAFSFFINRLKGDNVPLFKNRSFLVKMVKDEDADESNTLEVDIDEVRSHFRRNKNTYLAIGAGIGLAGITYLVMKSSVPVTPTIPNTMDGHDVVNVLPRASSFAKQTNNITTVLIRRGHPGTMVLCKETGEVFGSIARAAEANGINRPNLSSHLAGRLPHVGGLTFEKLGEAV